MGMRDKEVLFADKQAVTAAGDTPSANIYDSGVSGGEASADIGLMRQLWLNCESAAPVTAGGTMTAVLQHSTDAATWTDALVGPAVTAAAMARPVAVWQTALPVTLRRYLRVVWRVGGTALTGGAFSAWLSLDVQRNIARPSGFRVA
jgi:hypothetical protein